MSRRHGIIVAAALAALLVVLSGGLALAHMGHDSTTPTPKALIQGSWTLRSFTFDGQPQTLVPGVAITLSFHAPSGQVTGFNGCNSYGATYSLAQDRLYLGDLYQTLVGCLRPGVAEQEAHYMTALPLVSRYHLDHSGLTLRDDAGRYELRFTATASLPAR